MISIQLAQQLKEAGLIWITSQYDFFAIPYNGLDDRVFVLSDLQAQMDVYRGWPVVTFHGSSEWALDYILTKEVLWMPTETQLREELEKFVKDEDTVQLVGSNGRYTCHIHHQTFTAPTASDAYGQALLHLLKTNG